MRITALVVVVFILSGCFSLPFGEFNPLAPLQNSAEDRMEAEVASGTGLTGVEAQMAFQLVFAQVYYVGGFAYLGDWSDLQDGEGALWTYRSIDESGDQEEFRTERARLLTLPDDSVWWYLGWTREEEVWEFEVLLDIAGPRRVIRYYNPETERNEQTVFEPGEGEGAYPPSVYGPNWQDSILGTESVRVGAGTFEADRVGWVYEDPETDEKLSYQWWVSEDAPGGVVKFVWDDGEGRLEGELTGLSSNYRTRFDSF